VVSGIASTKSRCSYLYGGNAVEIASMPVTDLLPVASFGRMIVLIEAVAYDFELDVLDIDVVGFGYVLRQSVHLGVGELDGLVAVETYYVMVMLVVAGDLVMLVALDEVYFSQDA
jgi:hypothetical protein